MSTAGAPQRYEIVIRGRLSDRYRQAFDGVTLAPGPGRTALRVAFADQRQLHGLLGRPRDFGFELISVNAEP